MDKNLVLIRGISGSGKSTLAEMLANAHPVISADDFFIDGYGNYNWSGEKLGRAHRWCLNETRFNMIEEEEKIFVANTFTTEKELKPYYDLAKIYDYKVFSIVVENRHNGVNVHDVPDETVEKQRNRFKIKL